MKKTVLLISVLLTSVPFSYAQEGCDLCGCLQCRCIELDINDMSGYAPILAGYMQKLLGENEGQILNYILKMDRSRILCIEDSLKSISRWKTKWKYYIKVMSGFDSAKKHLTSD